MSVPVQALAGCQWHTDWGTLDCATRRVTSYTYDALGRLASVTEDQDPSSSSDTPLATGYKYDLRGNLDETHLPNGVIEDYVYDELNRLDTLTHYAPDETPEDLSDNDRLADFDYTVRADGKRTEVKETYWLDENEDGTPEPQITEIDWTYDSLGRLTSESIDHFDSQFSQTEWFEYDAVGNRLEKLLDSDFDGTVDEAIAYLYDANDRLTKEERHADNNGTVDQTTTYGYDGTQQTSKTVFDNSAQQKVSQAAFTYDLQGRLHTATITSFTAGDESRIERTTYDYDASGIRVSALHEIDTDANGTWDTTTRTEYLVDHQNFTGYQQVIKETVYDDQGNVVKTIEYNFGHDEISQTVTEFDAAGQITAKHTEIFGHDGHGSVKVLYDAAAAILQVFTYEAYGQMLAVHNAIAAVVTTGALTSLQYSGEQFDSRIDQQYLRARYYDPNSGRFNRLDPFAGNSEDPQSFHKYLYGHANPTFFNDPSGRFSVIGMVGAIGIGLGQSAAELGVGVLTIGLLQTAGQAGFNARAAGLLLIANGEHDAGYYLYTLGTRLVAVTFAVIDAIDTAIGLGVLGIGLGVAAFKLAKHAPALAESALQFSRQAFDSFTNIVRSSDNTLSLSARLEQNAHRWLNAFESSVETAPNAHFVGRHGSQTTLEQQYIRANTGLTPDGVQKNPVDASRFLTHRDQLTAVHNAIEIHKRTGKKVFSFDMMYVIGEGYLRNTDELVRTSNVTAVFDSAGRLNTLFPKLSIL